ncbi:uncharacterized protein LOC114353420 [Ostrinia furnacalis]|uniref:uncharacterized protein LOC114353420 n=1 Tax=Ostrinia furnacalis TaxID=93504 RepID=UPI00103E2878|nr:uncharacterized protein LOC114353420 [Ostrinia furnacalis]
MEEEFRDAVPTALRSEEKEVSTISLQSRIPAFWRAQPKLWFAQFEAVVSSCKIGDDQKYNLVIPVLERMDIEQVSDIICKPPATGKYTALKRRLLSVYEESESRQFQKLLSGLELGDQKPTQLLRVMRDLAGEKVTDDALKVLWMGHLPSQVRAVLSVSTESSLDTLAIMADKMMEHTDRNTIAEIASSPSQPSTSRDPHYELLSKQIEKLTLEIAAIRESRTNYRRPYRARSRSRSRTNGKKPGDPGWECFYHHRFGDKARKCEPPCARKPSSEN